MDKRQKRRVLSLSLSQPAKQNKKLKLKRHTPSSTENEVKDSPSEDSNSTRRYDLLNTCPITSDLPEKQVSRHSTNNLNDSSSCLLTTKPDENNGEGLAIDTTPEVCMKSDMLGGSLPSKPNMRAHPETRPPIEAKCIDPTSNSSLKEEDVRGTSGNERRPLKERPCSSPENLTECNFKALDKIGCKTSLKKTERYTDHQNVPGSEDSGIFSPDGKNSSVKKVIPPSSNDTKASRCAADDNVRQVSDESMDVQKEYIEVLQCPICNKSFDKPSTKTSHLKGCASKHKVSTQLLFQMLEVQQRQAAERRALGLPEIQPAVGNTKKSAPSKKTTENRMKMDNNLQLAMALSLSLQDQEKASAYSMAMKADSTAGISLDHFGFTSKSVLDAVQPRPIPPLPKGKTKGIDNKKVPTLLSRTTEERQRIITEKVAMVLLDEIAAGKNEKLKSCNLKSTFLLECQDKENELWSKSFTSPSKSDRASFYVNCLRQFISPSIVEVGSKIKHLSQVVGRVKTPTKVEKNQEVLEVASTSPTEEEGLSDASSSQPKKSKDPLHIEMELRAKLFNDWAGMVNNASMSDIAIYPKEGREIPSHKLILHARCPRILQDISKQRNRLTGNEVEVIMWSKTPHAAALAFLEYVYCGSVKSIRVLSDDLSSITSLAMHYKISDLLRYLNAVSENVCETPSQLALSVIRDSNLIASSSSGVEDRIKDFNRSQKNENTQVMKVKEDNSSCIRRRSRIFSTNTLASSAETPSRSETESIYSEITVAEDAHRSCCSSPDMFCDDEVIKSPENEQNDIIYTLNNPVHDGSRSECGPLDKHTTKSDTEVGDRPPSRCLSIQSAKTVINGSLSPSLSVASLNAEVLGKSSRASSPGSSIASAETEMLDFNQSSSKRASVSLNDSKRKHSDSSEEGSLSACKRPCALSTMDCPTKKADSNADFLDLTQDSDSSVSSGAVKEKLSEGSCEKICLSSDSESLSPEKHILETRKLKDVSKDKELLNTENSSIVPENQQMGSVGESSEDGYNVSSKLAEKVLDGYISPVWDGFEDLNYDDPYLFSELPAVPEIPSTKNGLSVNSPKLSSSDNSIPDFKEGNQRETLGRNGSPNKIIQQVDRNSRKSIIPSEIVCETSTSQRKPSSTCFDDLLDDSLNINDTLLQQAEGGICKKLTQRDTKGTPLNRILSSKSDDITPLANYSAMKTPELKRELQKFGLKPTLGKRKGKIMLRHIYNELHPWVPEESVDCLQEKLSLSQPCSSSKLDKNTLSSSQPNSRKLNFSGCDIPDKDAEPPLLESSQNSESDTDSNHGIGSLNTSLQEIKYMEDDYEDSESLSQPANKADLPKVVSQFITKNSKLHQQVLEYEPILIEKLHTDLRSNGHKFKITDLMTFLDEKCITFRTSQGGPRVKKRRPKQTSRSQKKVLPNTNSDTNETSD